MNLFELDQSSDLDDREESVRKVESTLSPDILLTYRRKITRSYKDPDTYAALGYCLGLGLHHLYLKKYIHFFFDLITGLTFWISFIMFVFTGQGLSWQLTTLAIIYNVLDFIYCLCFSQRIVRVWNIELAEKLVGEYSN